MPAKDKKSFETMLVMIGISFHLVFWLDLSKSDSMISVQKSTGLDRMPDYYTSTPSG